MFVIAVFMAIFSGMLFSAQTPVNSTLSKHTGHLEATVISFAGGFIILLVAVLVTGYGDLAHVFEGAPWMYLGGIYGMIMVLALTYAVPVLGVTLTFTVVMLGQILMGMVIDALGLFQTDVVHVGIERIIGCLLFAIGVIFVYSGKKPDGTVSRQHKQSKRLLSGKEFALLMVSFVSGVTSSMQSPTNAALAEITGTMEASMVSFGTGLICIILITLILRRGQAFKTYRCEEDCGTGIKGTGIRWWMFTGGVFGAVAIFMITFATPVCGVAIVVSGIMLGQLLCSALIDMFGLFRSIKIRMTASRIIGLVIVAVGVVVISLGS